MEKALAASYILLSLVAVLGLAERLARRCEPEQCRKIVHVAMGVSALPLPLFVSSVYDVGLLSLLVTLFLVSLRLNPDWWGGLGGVFRDTRPNSFGEFFFTAGIGLTLLFGHEDYCAYYAGVALLGFGDAAAAIVGKRWGRLRWPRSEKTLEGSAAFLITALALTGPALALQPAPSVLFAWQVCLAVTAVEALSPRGSDNLFVPVLTSWMIFSSDYLHAQPLAVLSFCVLIFALRLRSGLRLTVWLPERKALFPTGPG